MLTIVSFLFVITVVVIAHEFGHLLAAKKTGIGVDEFGIGMGPRLFGFKFRGTLYGVHLFPIGGYVNLTGEDGGPDQANIDPDRDFNQKPLRHRVAAIVWGPMSNLILAWGLLYIVFIFVGFPAGLTNKVAAVKTGSPAALAGLKSKDYILALNNKEVTSMENTIDTIHKWPPGQPLIMTVNRSGKKIDIQMTPEFNEKMKQSLVGFSPDARLKKYDPLISVFLSLKETGRVILVVLNGFFLLFTGKVGLDGMAGPLGIAQFTGQMAEYGLGALLQFTAFISINLGLVNLLPIPALDGGRILFLGIEFLRGRPLNPNKEKYFHMVGFAFLIALLILLTYTDLARILSHKSLLK